MGEASVIQCIQAKKRDNCYENNRHDNAKWDLLSKTFNSYDEKKSEACDDTLL